MIVWHGWLKDFRPVDVSTHQGATFGGNHPDCALVDVYTSVYILYPLKGFVAKRLPVNYFQSFSEN